MNDKKQIFGWAMYDWANSAYVTTVAVALFPLYFGSVIVPEEGFEILGSRFSAPSLLGFMSSICSFLIFLCAPILGAIADFSASKKKFLMVFCYGGSLFTILLFFCGSGDVWLAMFFFALTQIGFVGGNTFYDAFLPHIASEDRLDRVSGTGYAAGYLGGGLQFALSLGLVAGHQTFGISQELASRIAMTMAGIWWAGFSIITFVILKEADTAETLPKQNDSLPRWLSYAAIGIGRTVATARKVRRFKHLLLFLIAFMIFNDAIQTVIKMAAIYGQHELKISQTSILTTLLTIQFVAFFGALFFSYLAERISAKRTLILTLLLWTGVVVYAYFINSSTEFFILGIVIGLVLGGSQALSRSLYGGMIPRHAAAEFYGFYSIFTKFSAIFGTAIFALIDHLTGSSRGALISLSLFFVIGVILLSFVDVGKAKEARTHALFSPER